MKKQSILRKKAMKVSTLTQLRLFLRNALGPKKSKLTDLKNLKAALKQFDSAPKKSIFSKGRARQMAARRSLAGRVEGLEKYVANARQKQNEAFMPARLASLLGLGGAATYGGYKLVDSVQNPEFMDDYKLAADRWVSGFITKCADYNVDGLALLDTLCSGNIKKASFGRNLLATLIGAGILGTGWGLYNTTQKNRRLAAEQEAEKAKNLDKEQRKLWETTDNPYNFSYLNHLRNEPRKVKELTREQSNELAGKQNYSKFLAAEISKNLRQGQTPSSGTTIAPPVYADQAAVGPQSSNAAASAGWYVPPLTLGYQRVPNITPNIRPNINPNINPVTASRPAVSPAAGFVSKPSPRTVPKKGKIFGIDEDEWFKLSREQQQAIINNTKTPLYGAKNFNTGRLS